MKERKWKRGKRKRGGGGVCRRKGDKGLTMIMEENLSSLEALSLGSTVKYFKRYPAVWLGLKELKAGAIPLAVQGNLPGRGGLERRRGLLKSLDLGVGCKKHKTTSDCPSGK